MNTDINTTVLSESAVIDLVRREHARVSAVTSGLWQKLQEAEDEMQPYKERYQEILGQWSNAKRLQDSLAAVIKAKEPQPLVVEVA